MNPKNILARADKMMDPIGLIIIVFAYFANKFFNLEMSADDVLLASLGAGAIRTVWENYKRKEAASSVNIDQD